MRNKSALAYLKETSSRRPAQCYIAVLPPAVASWSVTHVARKCHMSQEGNNVAIEKRKILSLSLCMIYIANLS